MHFLEQVAVSDALVDELWDRVSRTGSYYSAADGFSHEHFRTVLFTSVAVFRGEDIVIRLQEHDDVVELHPIVFGHSVFHHALGILKEVETVSKMLFPNKPLCCIIPNRMKGARALARSAGLMFRGCVERSLSGASVPCGVWR